MQKAKSATFPLVMMPHLVHGGSWGLCGGRRVRQLNLCHTLVCPWVGEAGGRGYDTTCTAWEERDTGKPVLMNTVKPIPADAQRGAASRRTCAGGRGRGAARRGSASCPTAGTFLPRPWCRRQGSCPRGLSSGTGDGPAVGALAVARGPFWRLGHRRCRSSGSVGSAGARCVHGVTVSAGPALLARRRREPSHRPGRQR